MESDGPSHADPDGEEPNGTGYFAIFQGPTVRSARTQVRAPVAFSTVERCTAILTSRVEELLEERQGHVWIRAYAHGARAPMSSLRIEGEIDPEDHAAPERGDELAAAVGALVSTNRQILAENRHLAAKIDDYQSAQLSDARALALLATREGLMRSGARAAGQHELLKTLAPTVERLAAAWLAHQSGGPVAPSAATAAPDRLVAAKDRIVTAIAEIATLLQADPGLQTHPALAELREIAQQVVVVLGGGGAT